MESNRPVDGKGRVWVAPMVTKLAIGTHTKSLVAVDQGLESARSGSRYNAAIEPEPPKAPAAKFGFSLEWSFPLSVRTD